MKDNNKLKFVESILLELKYMDEVNKWSYKELADYLIQNVWGNKNFNKLGTLKEAVLNRVIEELFKLDESKLREDKDLTISSELHNITKKDYIKSGIRFSKDEDKKDNCCGGDCNCKPNKNVKVPKFDKLSEGCDPKKCE